MAKQLSIDEALKEQAEVEALQAQLEKRLADARAITQPYQEQIGRGNTLTEVIGNLADKVKKIPKIKADNALDHKKALDEILALMVQTVESLTGKTLSKRTGGSSSGAQRADAGAPRPLRVINNFLKASPAKWFSVEDIATSVDVSNYQTAKGMTLDAMKAAIVQAGEKGKIKHSAGKYQFKGE
jgi:hypothetical protein